MTSKPHNPITERIERLQLNWQSFTESEDSIISRWLIEPDELQMIDLFYELENSEHGRLPDLFLRFQTPLNSLSTYDESLWNELNSIIEGSSSVFQEEEITLDWGQLNGNSSGNDSSSFLNKLHAFKEQIPSLSGNIVAYLSPSEFSNVQEWEKWLSESIREGIPEGIRIMLVDDIHQPVFESLSQQFPQEVMTIQPALDMSSALQQLAAAGDPTNPGVQFRQLFLTLSQAASKQQWTKLEQLGQKTRGLARQEAWPDMEIAVLQLMGSTYLGANRIEQSLKMYQDAKAIAENAYKTNNPIGGKLLIQVLFSRAAAYLNQKNYDHTIVDYKTAAIVAEDIKDYFSLLEAHRMTAYCLEQQKQFPEAWEINQKGILAAEFLMQEDEDTCRGSAVPYVGEAMLRLAKKLGKMEMEPMIREKMEFLVGDHWGNQIAPKAKRR